MLLKIGISALIMMITTSIHTLGMMTVFNLVRRRERISKPQLLGRTNVYLISEVVIVMFLVSLIEVLIWASTYLALDAIEGLEQAFYFSMVTFTTVGYGDVVLNDRWRLLASFEAANGIIMFGWTTAIVMAVVQRIYIKKWNKEDNED